MPITTTTDLVHELAARVPELQSLYDEHLELHEEVLPSVFFGELVTWLVDDFVAREEAAAGAAGGPWREVLDILEREYHGSLAVEELIDFSFLEDLPYPEERGYGIIERLGPTLREALAQVESRPESTPDQEVQ